MAAAAASLHVIDIGGVSGPRPESRAAETISIQADARAGLNGHVARHGELQELRGSTSSRMLTMEASGKAPKLTLQATQSLHSP